MLKRNLLHKIAVEEFTTPCPVTVSKHVTLGDVSQLMDTHKIRHIPVVEENLAIGVVSDRDIKLMGKFPGWQGLRAGEAISSEPYTVTYDTKIDEVAYEMSERKIGSALVIDEIGEIMGIFTSTDALNALVEIVRGEV